MLMSNRASWKYPAALFNMSCTIKVVQDFALSIMLKSLKLQVYTVLIPCIAEQTLFRTAANSDADASPQT